MNYIKLLYFKRSFKQAVKKYQGKKKTISFWSTYGHSKFEYVQPKIDSKRKKITKEDSMKKLEEWKFKRGKDQEPWKKEEWKKKYENKKEKKVLGSKYAKQKVNRNIKKCFPKKQFIVFRSKLRQLSTLIIVDLTQNLTVTIPFS